MLTPEELENPVRKILHVDMDAFYASVEMRDHPEYVNRPMVVGGEGRGVVLTANYVARSIGVRSAMPGFKARQLCPNLVFVKPRFDAYVEASEKTRAIFARWTDQIEPRSLDEAWLDVTVSPSGKYAVQIAKEIRTAVKSEVGITCSVGVAQNKLLAKVASDFQKPDGLTVVLPEKVLEFLGPQKLRVIPGVGPVTDKWLASHGLVYCKDVWAFSPEELMLKLGERFGRWIWRKSRGIDRGRVCEDRGMRQSVGKQRSIGPGHHSREVLLKHLAEISSGVASRMARQSLEGRTVTLVLKHQWDKACTRSHTHARPLASGDEIFSSALELFERYEKKEMPIRLLGISVSGLSRFVSNVSI
jgi:DNA polymerase-4